MNKRGEILAAIDIGTNSFHLIVTRINPHTGRFRILTRQREIVRLGSSSSDMKYLSESATNKAIETLRHFNRDIEILSQRCQNRQARRARKRESREQHPGR